jgi:hypothetical protein
MLNREDSRRLAQLERQLQQDDPEFCARMTAGRPARPRVSLSLVSAAVVIWTVALMFGVVGWWIAASVAAIGASLIVAMIAYRCRPQPSIGGPGPLPRAW